MRHEMTGLYKRFSMDRAHAEHVASLCDRIFQDLPYLHGLPKTCRGMVEMAAILHDIDESPGKTGHDVRGARRIRSLRATWLPARWKPIIATAVQLHSTRSDVAGYLARLKAKPTVELEMAGRVAAILRVGDGLDHSRRQDTQIKAITDDGQTATIWLLPSPTATQNAAFTMKKADLWNRLASRPIGGLKVADGPIPDSAWVQPGQSIGQAARRILQRQFEQFASRKYGLGYRRDPEFVHEMRVAARRIHSALRAFERPVGGLRKLDDEVARLGACLGLVRDSDVLLEFLDGYIKQAPPSHLAILRKVVLRRRRVRQQQCGQLMAAFAGREYRDMESRFRRVIHTQVNTSATGRRKHAQREYPAWRAARQSLKQSLKRLFRHDRRVKTLSPRRQHQLRIDCRKLRYVAEFFQSFYGREFRDMIRTTIKLNDLLGAAHDSHVFAAWLKDESRRPARKSNVAVQWILDHLDRRRQECLDKVGRIWKSFRGRRSRKRLLRLVGAPAKPDLKH